MFTPDTCTCVTMMTMVMMVKDMMMDWWQGQQGQQGQDNDEYGDAVQYRLFKINDDNNDDYGDADNAMVMLFNTDCWRSTAHWPGTVWQWWCDLVGWNSPGFSSLSSSLSLWLSAIVIIHHDHPWWCWWWSPSTASWDPSVKSRFGPRVGFSKAAFVQHSKSTCEKL